MNPDKLMETIEAVEHGRYSCGFSDIVAICDAVGGGALETGSRCFNYGFLKGQRSERAAAKRSAKSSAPAYAALLSLLECNKQDAFFIRSVRRYADSLLRALEDGVPFTTPGVVPLCDDTKQDGEGHDG